MLKMCCHCKKELPTEEFQKNRSALDGLQHRCKACTKIASKTCRTNRGHLWLQKISPWKTRNSENRLRSNTSARTRRAKNPDKARKENREYRERNPFSSAATVARKRAKELDVKSTLTREEWREVVENHKFICHLCKEKVSLEIGSPDRLSLDHIVPMSRGGTNTKENVAPACRRCNQNRSDMLLGEFDLWLDKIYLIRRSGHGDST